MLSYAFALLFPSFNSTKKFIPVTMAPLQLSLNSALLQHLNCENKFVLFAWDRTSPSLPRFRDLDDLKRSFDWKFIQEFLVHLHSLAITYPGHVDPEQFAPHSTETECVDCLDRNPSLCFFYFFFGRDGHYKQWPIYQTGWYFRSPISRYFQIAGFRTIYENVKKNLEEDKYLNIFNRVRIAHNQLGLVDEERYLIGFDQALLERDRDMFHEVVDMVCYDH